ncbi:MULTISPECIES: Lrp/AsnC family transcriptional regulator [Cryobacterium]|uniref:Lrp/AsnC family transcriptional regulator n=2 Tax=Bacteria TaxID=2 RepID=A0ABY2IL06_9MICO|nr:MULTISPECIES: Lrp/AsnC family transcriptional regulator [Cryobacterium]MDY7526962.1 Lrp/AsnC family transcriptional regulator [Cryobacterium sp. 10C2]MDY7557240.1 Lrp/AsnC family transcriptional regulator [Cryobacterium sp. 10C3]MEB0201184.1 Lrp/AsnC family transcriptional regulator [Cryobacterium sp. 5I3]MEB0287452.1 Lrp/AsnC family transcriptional regulator [Cryobacterium sp. 10S3]MEB0290389.1 Lrp/AsnC family transcriptional regulator [Cryobacterium sp. 10C2]
MPLDDLDHRLISLLRVNGREPVAALARELGVTRSTVDNRLARLVQSGTVVGFSIRVREDQDPGVVQAISFIEVEGRATSDVIRALRGYPEVSSLHTTNGAWDLVAELRTADLGEFDRLLGRIRSIPGVLNSETSLLLSSVSERAVGA